jgi:orotidine-5'-phosphate decarboxylase
VAAARGREDRVSLTPQRPEASDDDLNPHRRDDQTRVAAEIRGNLHQRGIDIADDETGADLVTLLESVERFERARSALGGDSMINTPGTRQPERDEFVIPKRRADESIAQYASRVDEAARKLA